MKNAANNVGSRLDLGEARAWAQSSPVHEKSLKRTTYQDETWGHTFYSNLRWEEGECRGKILQINISVRIKILKHMNKP